MTVEPQSLFPLQTMGTETVAASWAGGGGGGVGVGPEVTGERACPADPHSASSL